MRRLFVSVNVGLFDKSFRTKRTFVEHLNVALVNMSENCLCADVRIVFNLSVSLNARLGLFRPFWPTQLTGDCKSSVTVVIKHFWGLKVRLNSNYWVTNTVTVTVSLDLPDKLFLGCHCYLNFPTRLQGHLVIGSWHHIPTMWKNRDLKFIILLSYHISYRQYGVMISINSDISFLKHFLL